MATIFCFSSTGNSLYAAKEISRAVDGTVLPMTGAPTVCEDDVIGFVFPIYFWGLPREMERFVSGLTIANKNAYVFGVITCGALLPGVLGLLKKRLQAQGVQLRFGAKLVMGSNYLPEFETHDSEKKRKRIARRLERITGKIKNREASGISSFTAINESFYKKFYPTKDCDKFFTVSSACTGCGTCQKVCPLGNIEMLEGRPSFKHNCDNCIGCLHACPAAAIDWKEGTKGKERYRNHAVSLKELISLNNRGLE